MEESTTPRNFKIYIDILSIITPPLVIIKNPNSTWTKTEYKKGKKSKRKKY